MARVMICGSRRANEGTMHKVDRVVASLLKKQRTISVGCASGVDAAAVSSVIRHGGCSRLSVFAIGNSGGEGFTLSASAFEGVQAAAQTGAQVAWCAGGGLNVSMRARLARRSLACVQSLSTDDALIAFVANSPGVWSDSGVWRSCSSGTWSSVLAAILSGVPVFVFPIGDIPLPLLPIQGDWVVNKGTGLWRHFWRFKYQQNSLF